jgi:hypothetical protein
VTSSRLIAWLALGIVVASAQLRPEGRDFSELGFTDPDGHVVVLYQLD